MKTIWLIILVIIAAIIIWGGFTAWGRRTNPKVTPTPSPSQVRTTSPTSEPSTSSAPEASSAVNISNFSFNPSQITVTPGTKVTWTNNDSTAHTVTSDTNAFGSQPIQPGKTFSFTFNSAGTFAYHCSIHPTMTGSIIVK